MNSVYPFPPEYYVGASTTIDDHRRTYYILNADTPNNPITITLPNISNVNQFSGITLKFKRMDNTANVVTIRAATGDYIDLVASVTLAGRQTINVSNVSLNNWYVT